MGSLAQRVLIVDDEAGLRRSLHAALLHHGVAVDEAEDGLSALERITSAYHEVKPFGAVVVDINLPDINGLKLLEVIKSRYPTLPVLVISGYGTDETPDDVVSRGGDGYLTKPFTAGDLLALLDRAVAAQRTPESAPEAKDPGVAASGYVLLRLAEGVDRVTLYRQLTFSDHVVYCDAVRERADLVLLLNAPEARDLDTVVSGLRALDEVVEVDYAAVVRPSIDDGLRHFIAEYERYDSLELRSAGSRGSDVVLAYALLEVSREQLAATYPVLQFMDSVVSCDATKGFADIVLLLKAQSHAGLRGIAEKELRAVPGILRARLLPIIEMLQM